VIILPGYKEFSVTMQCFLLLFILEFWRMADQTEWDTQHSRNRKITIKKSNAFGELCSLLSVARKRKRFFFVRVTARTETSPNAVPAAGSKQPL
jgi:hypothetical protein